jgi:hypothetical protein
MPFASSNPPLFISRGCASITPRFVLKKKIVNSMALPLHVMVAWRCPSMKNREWMALPLHVMVTWRCPSMKNREWMALPLHVMVVWRCPSMKNREWMALPLHVMVAWRCPSMKRVVVWRCPPTSLPFCGCVAMPPMSLQNRVSTALPLHVVFVWRSHPSTLLPINDKTKEVPQDCLFALYCIIVNRIVPKLLKTKCGIG